MNAHRRGEGQQAVGTVVAVAHVSQREVVKASIPFPKSEEIGQALAGVVFIREGIDDRDAAVGSKLLYRLLGKGAGCDGVHIAS